MGRKSLPATERLHQIQAAVTLPVKDYLEKLAEQDERSVSQVVRRLLEESLQLKVKPSKKNGNRKGR